MPHHLHDLRVSAELQLAARCINIRHDRIPALKLALQQRQRVLQVLLGSPV